MNRIVTRIQALGLLLAATLGLLLAVSTTGTAMAHGHAMHAVHQTHAEPAPDEDRPGLHADRHGHHQHNDHQGLPDCTLHPDCDCSGGSYCGLKLNTTGVRGPTYQEFAFAALKCLETGSAQDQTTRDVGVDPPDRFRTSLPPPILGWRSRLHSNTPRLRI